MSLHPSSREVRSSAIRSSFREFVRPIALILAGAASILSCGGDKTSTAPPAATPVLTTIAVTFAASTIQVGQTTTATAAGLDQNGMPIALGSVTWSTGSSAVASVSASGVVTGLSAGQVAIIATVGSRAGQSSMTVSPVPVANVSITPAIGSIVVGATLQLAASAVDASGSALPGRIMVWSSSDTTKARVSTTGLVTAVSSGTVTITATCEGRSGAAVIGVVQQAVASVSIQPASTTLAVGATQQFTAVLRDSTGVQIVGRTVSWASADSLTARVSASGIVTAIAPGLTTVSASREGKVGLATITVPVIGSWSTAPDLPDARTCHSAAAFQGKIYVFGGIKSEGTVTIITDANQFTDVFVFDPALDSWTRRNPMPTPRTCGSAVATSDRIYIVGGYTSGPTRLATATLVYDPASDSWTTTGGLQRPRAYLAPVAIANVLLAVGGYDGSAVPLNTIESYDFATGRWTESLVGLQIGRWSHGAAVLNGVAYVVGGFTPFVSAQQQYRSVEQLSVPLQTSLPKSPLQVGRVDGAVTAFGNCIYAFGGNNLFQSPANRADGERYDPVADRWIQTAAMRQARSQAVAVGLGGKIYLIGGIQNAVSVSTCTGNCALSALASVEVFVP